jgi:ABC-type transporter Mla MlaB component
MSALDGTGTWALPEQVTLPTVAALFRACAAQPAAIRAVDLSQVRQIDSAGVALLHWLRDRQRALGLVPAPVRGEGAARYRALCRAHRLDDRGETAA